MRKAVRMLFLAALLCAASPFARAAFVVEATQTSATTVRFAMWFDEDVDVLALTVGVTLLDAGILGPAADTPAGSDLDVADWDPGTVGWPAAGDPQSLSMIGLVASGVDPITVAAFTKLFTFDLPIQTTPTDTTTYDFAFSFERLFSLSETADPETGEGRGSFTIEGVATPSPNPPPGR